jgi:hypothetical protein
MKPAIPEEILAAQRGRQRIGRQTQAIVMGLGILSVIASLSVSTFEPELGSFRTRVFAFVAALAAASLSAFGVVQKNKDVWTAWRMLRTAFIRYQHQEDFTLVQLINVYYQGGAITW